MSSSLFKLTLEALHTMSIIFFSSLVSHYSPRDILLPVTSDSVYLPCILSFPTSPSLFMPIPLRGILSELSLPATSSTCNMQECLWGRGFGGLDIVFGKKQNQPNRSKKKKQKKNEERKYSPPWCLLPFLLTTSDNKLLQTYDLKQGRFLLHLTNLRARNLDSAKHFCVAL